MLLREERLSKLVHQREPPLYIIRAVTQYPTKANLMKKIGGRVSIHTATTNWIPPGLQSCPKKGEGEKKKKIKSNKWDCQWKEIHCLKRLRCISQTKKGKKGNITEILQRIDTTDRVKKKHVFLMRATN